MSGVSSPPSASRGPAVAPAAGQRRRTPSHRAGCCRGRRPRRRPSPAAASTASSVVASGELLERAEIGCRLIAENGDDLPPDGGSRIVGLAERRRAPVAHNRFGRRGNVGAVLDQHGDDVGMALVGSLHQRGRAARVFLRVHVGAAIEQCADRIDVPGARGQHQRPAAERQLLVRIRAALQQRFDHRCVALARREPHRSRAVTVGRGNIGAGLEQQQRQAHVAVVSRPVQRRGAVGLRSLHVGTALHEAAHLRGVAPHRGIRHSVLRDRRARGPEDQRERDCDDLGGVADHRLVNRPVLSPMLSRSISN